MSDQRRPEPPADNEPFRMMLDEGRLRIDSHGVLIDVPLTQIEQYTVCETADPDVFALRMCLDIRVSEVVMRHRGNPSGFEAIMRAWKSARAGVTDPPSTEPTADDPDLTVPVAVEPAQGEAATHIGGPPLMDDGPDWLVFGPLPDTRLLSTAELLIPD